MALVETTTIGAPACLSAHQVVQKAVFFCAIFIDNWYFGTNEVEGVDVAAVIGDHFYDLVGVRVIPCLPFHAAHLVVGSRTSEVAPENETKEECQISTGDGLLFTRNCNFVEENYSTRTQQYASRMANAADRAASTELNWKNTTRAYLNRFLGKYRNTGETKSIFANGRASTSSYSV